MIRLLPVSKYFKVAKSLMANRRAGESIYPFYASFKLTSHCHFSCRFCNIKDETRPDMPTDKVKRILDNLSKSSVILVSFEGGEPLLRKDIGELLRYAREKNFYLLFTTSERHLERYPMREYARFIDFIHISIDEGHNNMEMYSRLAEYREYGTQLSIQVVVTRDTLPALPEKAGLCHAAGANMVIMPAVHMNRTQDCSPDLNAFREAIRELKKRYPNTIYTPDGYFDAVESGRCSTASVIIDSDGTLFYPCHIQEKKGPDLSLADLTDYLTGPDGAAARKVMRACGRRCGWYQYFSINDFVSVRSAWQSLRPALAKGFKRP